MDALNVELLGSPEILMPAALDNLLIIRKIVNSLTFPDLLACRSLSRNWSQACSEILLRRQLCKIKFRWFRKKIGYTSLYPQNKELQLGGLVKLVQNHVDLFPCTNFAFQGGHLGDPDLTSFFTLFGPRIRTLELELDFDGWGEDEAQSIENLLMTQVPNLTKLVLHDDLDDRLWSPTLFLPRLKSFAWEGEDMNTRKWILESAPNLESINFFQEANDDDLPSLKMIVSCPGQSSKLRQLKCSDATRPEILMDLVNAGPPQLQILEFKIFLETAPLPPDQDDPNDIYHRQAVAFKKLLEQCKPFLEQLYLGDLCTSYEIRMPAGFTKLEKLSLGGSTEECPCFLAGINFQQTFPNLVSLDCVNLNCDDEDSWEIYFPQEGEGGEDDLMRNNLLPTVKILHVADDCCEFWMSKLRKLCPNFTKLTIECYDGLTEFLSQVFKTWQHLKGIVCVKHRLSVKMEPDDFPNFDPLITGMTEETCDRLVVAERESSYIQKIISKRGGLQSWRVQPSICDMKELTTFDLHFKMTADGVRRMVAKPSFCLMSEICGVYGFSLMPRLLRPKIFYDNRKFPHARVIFEDILPFVNLVHEPDRKEEDWTID